MVAGRSRRAGLEVEHEEACRRRDRDAGGHAGLAGDRKSAAMLDAMAKSLLNDLTRQRK